MAKKAHAVGARKKELIDSCCSKGCIGKRSSVVVGQNQRIPHELMSHEWHRHCDVNSTTKECPAPNCFTGVVPSTVQIVYWSYFRKSTGVLQFTSSTSYQYTRCMINGRIPAVIMAAIYKK